MRKAVACMMALAVGCALVQLAGCGKSSPAAVGNMLVGVWKGNATPKEEGKKEAPGPDMPVTIEFKDGGGMTFDIVLMTLKRTWEVL